MPAGATYEPISTTTLGSNVTSFTLTSIPSTYTDLVVVIQGKTSTQQLVDCGWRANGDSGSNYSHVRWTADSGGQSSDRGTNQTAVNCSGIGFNQSLAIFNFFNYSSTNVFKRTLQRASIASNSLGMWVINGIGSWRSTAAINQLEFFIPAGQSGTFVAGMTVTLYGITAA